MCAFFQSIKRKMDFGVSIVYHQAVLYRTSYTRSKNLKRMKKKERIEERKANEPGFREGPKCLKS